MNTSRNTDNPFDFDVSAWPALPRLSGIFVAGTDTGVGKTIVAGAIARHLRHAGRKVEVFKPVATGCRRTLEGLVSHDAEFLAACADSTRSLAEIAPLRFGPALAPNVAARRAGREVELEEIFAAYRRLEGAAQGTIVEGVGGLLCPISDNFWVIHLARMMQLPLVIVCRAALGTLNHTLLTIHAARSAGIRVAGVVINRYRLEGPARQAAEGWRQRPHDQPDVMDDGLAIFTNPQQIADLGKTEILAIVPEEEGNSVAKATLGKDTMYCIGQGPWEKLLTDGMTNSEARMTNQ